MPPPHAAAVNSGTSNGTISLWGARELCADLAEHLSWEILAPTCTVCTDTVLRWAPQMHMSLLQ
jgi:hypothetical protein